MSSQTVLAQKTVKVSELRKNPTKFFEDGPVAVLSHSRTAGYMVNAELFERMASVFLQTQQEPGFTANFRVSSERLKEIGKKGFELMENPKPEEIGEFAE